jgi:hypothetical protein
VADRMRNRMPNLPPQPTDDSHARRVAWHIGLITLAGTALFFALILAHAGWNPLYLAHIGTRFSESDPLGTTGYDGQFFYFIARDWARATPLIDGPSLRYMRILYPALARALALGRPALVPWTLILVNLLAHSAGTAQVAYLLARRGVAPVYGLIYAVWLGALFALRLDLSEPLCFALALGATVAHEHRRIWLTLLLLVLAALTKELGLVFAGGLVLHAALGRRRWPQAVLTALVPLTAFLGWLAVVRLWVGEFPTRYPAARFSFPLYGWFSVQEPLNRAFTSVWLALPALALVVMALADAVRTRQISLGIALVLAGAGFVMVMPGVSWDDPVAAYRVGMPLVITGLIFLAEHHPRLLSIAAGLWVPPMLVIFLVPGLI